MHFYYNISYLSEREKILAAEFHVFKMRPAPPTSKETKPPYVIEVIFINPYVYQENSTSLCLYLHLPTMKVFCVIFYANVLLK